MIQIAMDIGARSMTVRNSLKSSTAAITNHGRQRPVPAGMARLRYAEGMVLDVPVSDGIVWVPRGGEVEIEYDVGRGGVAA